MGYYAELFRSRLAEPVADWPGAAVVVASPEPPSPDHLAHLFPRSPDRWVVTAGADDRGRVRVEDGHGRPRSLGELPRAIRDSGGPVILLAGVDATPAWLLVTLLRHGGWWGLEYGDRAWRRVSMAKALALRLSRVAASRAVSLAHRATAGAPQAGERGPRPRAWATARRLVDRLLTPTLDAERWRHRLPRARSLARLDPDRGLRIDLYLGSLNSGGAERQHGNLAARLARRGHRVRMLTTNALTGPDAHYLEMFAGWGIPVAQAGSRPTTVDEEDLRQALDRELIESISGEIRDRVVDLAGELLEDPPDVLHCTLDYTNVVGAAAGLLVGAPVIVLSTRNVNPSTFSFYRPWMTPWYRFLAREPRVRFIANSHHGARDYARWMGVEPSRIAVVLNGVDLEGIREPAWSEVAAVRTELSAGEGTPVVAGIFRLSWEKQPFVFLDVVQRVAREVPGLKVPLIGIGPLEREVRRQIAERRLSDTVVLLGQRSDVPAILAASDLLLLASAHEGTPNVVLEAEWLRRPVVATAVGGTPDATVDQETGLLHGQRDVEGLAGSVLRLLRDPALRERMGQAGRQFVARAFSVDRMVDETLAVYGPPPVASAPRAVAYPAETAR